LIIYSSNEQKNREIIRAKFRERYEYTPWLTRLIRRIVGMFK